MDQKIFHKNRCSEFCLFRRFITRLRVNKGPEFCSYEPNIFIIKDISHFLIPHIFEQLSLILKIYFALDNILSIFFNTLYARYLCSRDALGLMQPLGQARARR